MPSPARYAFSLSLQFAAIFWLLGLSLAYLPAWLLLQGLDSGQIGLILGLAFWGKIPLNLTLAPIADRRRNQHHMLLAMAAVIVLVVPQLSQGASFGWLLATWGVCGALLSAAIPTADSLAVIAWRAGAIDYGRTRLWGSGGFVLATIGGGWWLQCEGIGQLPALMLAGAGLMLLAGLLLPRPPARRAPTPAAAPTPVSRVGALLRRRAFQRFLLVAALLQSAHAVLYGFASVHWRAAGHGDATIGWLWAQGVLLEIVLFALGRAALSRLGWRTLLFIAAGGGIVRWCGLAWSTTLPALIALQSLHALTFACTHLGVMSYIARHVEEELTASAQALYDSLALGLVFGVCMIAAGEAYQLWQGGAFLLMAGLSSLALALLPGLPARAEGERARRA